MSIRYEVTMPLNELTASEGVRWVRAHAIRSTDLVNDCLARIRERDSVVRAWACVDPQAALAEAHLRDSQSSHGALQGIPIGIKDVLDTFDLPTQMGSVIYKGHRPKADSSVVALLRNAGAVI